MLHSLALWGVTALPQATPAEEAFEVARANSDSIAAWLASETQWRAILAPSGRWIWLGLDYAAVDVVLRRQQPADPDLVFADLQLMEREAIATFAEITE